MPQPCCSHAHDCEASDCGTAFSLYKHITLDHVKCFNEETPDTCKGVFRAWQDRLQVLDNPLRSNEDDPELLLFIPLDGAVKLQGIQVIGGSPSTAPSKVKLYTNRDDLDFSAVQSVPPVQELELQADQQGLLEYPVQAAKFNGVHSLYMYFPESFGGGQTEIHFIGLKGEFTERRRQAVQAVYESRAMPEDHKVDGLEHGTGFSHVA